MKILFALVFLLTAQVAFAGTSLIALPESSADLIAVENPEFSSTYYGELVGFPHTYEITANESFTLFTQILIPDLENSEADKSGIIVRKRDNGRGVEAVSRLHAADADWESFLDVPSGESYRAGPQFEEKLGPGVYRIEVSTPTNEGKYALVIGNLEDENDVGYFGKIGQIYEVKKFLGKSPISMVTSPLIYWPLIVLIIIGFIGRRLYKKKHG